MSTVIRRTIKIACLFAGVCYGLYLLLLAPQSLRDEVDSRQAKTYAPTEEITLADIRIDLEEIAAQIAPTIEPEMTGMEQVEHALAQIGDVWEKPLEEIREEAIAAPDTEEVVTPDPADAEAPTHIVWSDYTLTQLRKICSKNAVPKASRLTKAQAIAALEGIENPKL